MRTDEILNPFKAAEARRQAKHIDDVINDMIDDEDLGGSNVSLIWAIDDVPMGYTHLLKPVLDKHKKTILLRLLTRLKFELNDGDIGRYTRELVDALTRAGLEWPELNAIRKSLHSDSKSIEEDDEWPFDDEPPRHVLDRMQAKVDRVIEQLYNAAAEGEEHSAWQLLSEIRDMVDNNLFIGDVNLKDEGIDLNPVKDGILKRLLMLIRAGKIRHARSIERLIHEDWPELTIIRNSLKSVRQLGEGDEEDMDDVAALQREREDAIEEVIDAMTHGGSSRTFRDAKNAMQGLDQIGEDMLEDEMHKKKASIVANLVDMFFTSDRRTLESFMQLIEYSPNRIPELSNLPDSIIHTVEKEFDERARYHGLAKTLEDVDALSENGFDREYLMNEVRDYKLAGFVRTYGIGAYSNAAELGRDLAAMLEMGVDKNELMPVAEKRKSTIIKALLVGMKNRNYQDVNILMAALEDLGVDWSELNAVRKSLGSLHTLG